MNEFELRVVFRSDAEVVVVKPAGLHSEIPPGGRPSALQVVRATEGWPEARLPHRIDALTRGYLLVARDAASAAHHSKSVRERLWTKGYLARLQAPRDAGALIGLHKRYLKPGRRATCVRSGGDPAFMEIVAVAPVAWDKGQVHVAIRLLTGRYHQIRAIASDLGAPLSGDELYGGDPTLGSPYLEHALFQFPAFEGRVIRLFDAGDPEREEIDARVIDALTAL